MQILAEKEAEEFLEQEGFPVSKRCITPSIHVGLAWARKISFPVALKVVSSRIIHKSEVNGVRLDIRNEEEFKKNFGQLMHIRSAEEVMIEPFTHGIPLLLGLKKDLAFGHTIVVGWGDIYTEVLKDISLRICPVNEKEVLSLLQELKVNALLEGTRGRKPVSKKKLARLIVNLSHLPKKYPKIKELDINPLLVSDKEMRIIDARIVFQD